MELYFGRFFWGFNQGQLAGLQIAALISASGLIATPIWSRWLGKKWGAIWAYAIALAIGASPIALRLAGIMPPNGHPMLYPIIFVETIANGFFAIMTGVLLTSMIADVVEDVEVRTGRRSEGLLFSADNLFKKLVSAAGPLVAGLILSSVHFPANARQGVSHDVLQNLGFTYLPVAVTLYAIAIACLLMFRLDKTKHDENLRTLAERQAESDEVQQPSQPGQV